MAYNFVTTVTDHCFVGRYEICTSGSMCVAAQRIIKHQIATTSIIDHHIFYYIFHFLIDVGSYTGWRKKNGCFLICLRFLSVGLPQIKSLRSKTSYSRRSESFHSRRNFNCATRNVSKCDAELWGEAPDVCTARRTPSFLYNFP